jgi:prepilin peptidase CpaA
MILVAGSLLYISVKDFISHTISNSSILVVAVLLFIQGNYHVRILWPVTLFIVCVSLINVVKIGGGDVKLGLCLVAFSHPRCEASWYFAYTMIVIAVLLVIHRLKAGNWAGNVALAPAICLPYVFAMI